MAARAPIICKLCRRTFKFPYLLQRHKGRKTPCAPDPKPEKRTASKAKRRSTGPATTQVNINNGQINNIDQVNVQVVVAPQPFLPWDTGNPVYISPMMVSRAFGSPSLKEFATAAKPDDDKYLPCAVELFANVLNESYKESMFCNAAIDRICQSDAIVHSRTGAWEALAFELGMRQIVAAINSELYSIMRQLPRLCTMVLGDMVDSVFGALAIYERDRARFVAEVTPYIRATLRNVTARLRASGGKLDSLSVAPEGGVALVEYEKLKAAELAAAKRGDVDPFASACAAVLGRPMLAGPADS